MEDLKNEIDQLETAINKLGARALNLYSVLHNVHFILKHMRIMIEHDNGLTLSEKKYLLNQIKELEDGQLGRNS